MIKVVFYKDDRGKKPVQDWMDGLTDKLLAKCRATIELLSIYGHRLRRPAADYLRDDIFELRIVSAGNQHRILYFFHGRKVVVLSNAFLKKQSKVPKREIEIAIKRKKEFCKRSAKHT